MTAYKNFINRTVNPSQSAPLDDRQVKNNAGGYVYGINKFDHLLRFLILGSEGGTYYVGESKLTAQNANIVKDCLDTDFHRTISMLIDVSVNGRAVKNDPAIFALAMAASHSNPACRSFALDNLSVICRIPTHLFMFADFVSKLRGWGRGLRNAVARWYLDHNNLAYHVAKYRQRNGWAHRDLIRLSHPNPATEEMGAVFKWCIDGEITEKTPALLNVLEALRGADSKRYVLRAIKDFNLTWEMIPTEWLKDADIWEALLQYMPMGAMVRNLGRFASLGMTPHWSDVANLICGRLSTRARVLKSRLHPLSLFVAQKVYASGRGVKGSMTWTPNAEITDALDTAFELSFGNVPSTGKRRMVALDISGSMGYPLANMPVTCAEGVSALASITLRAEELTPLVMAFANTIQPVNVRKGATIRETTHAVGALRWDWSKTDCAQPMLYALHHGLMVDSFEVYTDNETWAGGVHPMKALRDYRKKINPNAKLTVVGMVSTGFSIADPKDGGCLDVVGFDTSTPAVIREFIS